MPGVTVDAGALVARDRDDPNVGRLLAATGIADIADAHVVICARRSDQPAVMSGRGDLSAHDPSLRLSTL